MGDSSTFDRDRPTGLLLVAAILIAVGLAMRLYGLGTLPGVNGDEAWYGNAAAAFWGGGPINPMTPNGNMAGPGQLYALILLQSVFPPSIELLRAPTVLVSLIAIALSYLVAAELGGKTVGTIAALFMATLPINIAYARFGWDPSYAGAFVLLVAYIALRGRLLLAGLIMCLGPFFHGTVVFAVPFLFMLVAWDMRAQASTERTLWPLLGFGALLAVAPAISFVLAQKAIHAQQRSIVDAALDFDQWRAFLGAVPSMFTGQTVFRYITGEGMGVWAAPAALAFTALLAAAAIVALMRKRAGVGSVWAGAGLGVLASLAMIYLFVGVRAVSPHFERYGFVIVAPTVIAIALLLVRAFGPRAALGVSLVCAGVFLVATANYYFEPLQRGAPNAFHAFQTGTVEPKAAAATEVRKLVATRPGLTLVADDYWLSEPIQYLAQTRAISPTDLADPPVKLGDGQLWIVYDGSTNDRRLATLSSAKLQWQSGGTVRINIWETGKVPPSGNR